MNKPRPQRRSGTGLALPVTAILLAVGGVVLFLVMQRDGQQSVPVGGGPEPKPVGTAAGKNDPPAALPKAPGATGQLPGKPSISPAEVEDLLKLAGGEARDQYKGFGGLRRIAKDGLRPDLAKQIVDHARKLIESGEKEKVKTGIKLIEVSGDCQQGEFVILTWEKHLDDKDIDFVARAALGNLLQGHRNVSLAKSHPEWSKAVVQEQAMLSASSSCMPCGSDPAKWRELWKGLLVDSGAKSDEQPVDQPEAKPEEKLETKPGEKPPVPEQP